MALTRKLLRSMGIEDEKAEEIITAHMETVDALKAERDEYKTKADDFETTSEKLKTAEEKLSKLETSEETVLKKDYDELAKQLDDYKAKETHQTKEKVYRDLLAKSNISENWIDKILKLSNVDEIELNDEGKIKDIDKYTQSINTEYSDYMVKTEVKGADTANPPVNNPTEKDPFEMGFDEN